MKRYEEFYEVMKIFYILMWVWVTQLSVFIKHLLYCILNLCSLLHVNLTSKEELQANIKSYLTHLLCTIVNVNNSEIIWSF